MLGPHAWVDLGEKYIFDAFYGFFLIMYFLSSGESSFQLFSMNILNYKSEESIFRIPSVTYI